MCHNPPLIRNKPLGASESVKLVYYVMCFLGMTKFISHMKWGSWRHDVSDHRQLDSSFSSLFRVTYKNGMTGATLCEGNPRVTVGWSVDSPHKWPCDAESVSMSWRHHAHMKHKPLPHVQIKRVVVISQDISENTWTVVSLPLTSFQPSFQFNTSSSTHPISNKWSRQKVTHVILL